MKKPEAESDLVRLVKDLERKRQEKQKYNEELDTLNQDLGKILRYFTDEQAKLHAKMNAVHRNLKVKNVELENVEQMLRVNLGLRFMDDGVKSPVDS